MSDNKLEHIALTQLRGPAFVKLFGGKPEKIFPFHGFDDADDAYLIDILIFSLDLEQFPGRVVAAVTNGMSDYVMTDAETGARSRCELIQYFHDCDVDHAQRLYDLAWLPLMDGFSLGEYQTIAMPDAVLEDSPLKNAFFLPPLLTAHKEFRVEIKEMPVRLLWHVPISDDELAFKKQHGANALIERMQAAELPWIFDEAERPPLL
jgi:hypothetical protein